MSLTRSGGSSAQKRKGEQDDNSGLSKKKQKGELSMLELIECINSLKERMDLLVKSQADFHDVINSRLNDLEDKIEKSISIKINKLVEEPLAAFNQRLNDFNEKLQQLENNPVDSNNIVTDKLSILDDKLDLIERNERKSNLIISNLPHCSKITDVQLVERMAVAINMEKLELSVVRVIRLKRKQPAVLVVFRDENAKNRFMSSYFKFGNLSAADIGISEIRDRIYVNDDLTKRNGDIFREARSLKRRKKIMQIKIRTGQIYIKIDEEHDLTKVGTIAELQANIDSSSFKES